MKDKAIIEQFISDLYKKYRVNIITWEPNKIYYPEHLFLKGDRGILAYIKFYVILSANNDTFTVKLDEIIKIVSRGYSELDRPIFIVYIVYKNGKPTMYFETGEQIIHRINYDAAAINVSKNQYCTNSIIMGDLPEFINLLKDMRKKGVIN